MSCNIIYIFIIQILILSIPEDHNFLIILCFSRNVAIQMKIPFFIVNYLAGDSLENVEVFKSK